MYAEEILETEIWIQNEIRQLDSMQKVLITSHDAFSYFGRKYGIEVKGIQGVSTLSEVGLKDISDMVEFIIQRNIPSIFVETSTSQKTAQSILDGCAAKNYTVQLAGPLYSDALGEPDTDAGTYTGMLRENVRMIVNSLTK
ncbi:MAG: zinc ABC transporter substrate-binding protein [Crocinitomicaceae bacterium]|nr:zinc ABC transporter substrate-binding protein [Crocinitomicaceae bacterium]